MRSAGLKPIADINWASRPYRIVSLEVSRLVVGLRISSTIITSLSALVVLAGAFVLLWLTRWTILASALLIHVFILLDHVDGEVSRVERHRGVPATSRTAGSYYDILIHFIQGSAFFACLGVGLAWENGNRTWAVLGILAAIAAGGFQWLVAQHAALTWIATSTRDLARIQQVAEDVSRHALLDRDIRWKSFLVPQSISEAKWLAKQVFGFPTSMMIYSVAAFFDAVFLADRGYLLLKAFLALLTVLRVSAAVEGVRRYFKMLGGVQ